MERVDANLIPFAKNNPSGYRFAFGTDTATDDINVNYNDNIKKGWGTTPNEFPEVEDFNAMAYTVSYLTAYLYQMGISEWNNKQKYKNYSRVIGSDGKIYKAKTGTDIAPNVNNNPTTDAVNWEWESKNFVTLTENQTIAGVKTFSSTISGSISGNAGTVTNGVYTTGNQTIAGVKTFSSSPIVPTPTAGTQAVNKDYADLKVALTAFTGANQNLVTNGYQKLPGGLIIQWGSAVTSASGDVTVTFPIAFPNNLFSITLASNVTDYTIHTFQSPTLSNFFLQAWVPSTGAPRAHVSARYIAIGY